MTSHALLCRAARERSGWTSPNNRFSPGEVFLQALAAEVARPCAVAVDVPFDPATDLLRSRLLGPAMLPAGEPWPCNLLTDTPLAPLLQVNLTEPAFVPAPLRGYAWLGVFLDPDEGFLHSDLDEGWTVRLYKDLDALAPRPQPPAVEASDRFERRWGAPRAIEWVAHHEIMDCSSHRSRRWDQAWFQESGADQYFRSLRDLGMGLDRFYGHDRGTKLGGFPTCTQGELEADAFGPDDPDHFVLQIRATPGCFDLCDYSCTHLGYRRGEWMIHSWTS